ncbi:hypothetical protein [Candidatus Methylomirabilis sp.]|uniref:hypothetical protein n=1 Tax=Candidatus Methylomirabilis sp. TaxID=2032687 RepID=UPI003C7348B0
MAGERGSRRMALQEREFILGGQFNEDGTTRLEVALLDSGGKTRLELRLLGWGEGIGWYVQKRIQLDPLQIRALRGILGRGEGRMKSFTPRLKMTRKIEECAEKNPQRSSVSVCP